MKGLGRVALRRIGGMLVVMFFVATVGVRDRPHHPRRPGRRHARLLRHRGGCRGVAHPSGPGRTPAHPIPAFPCRHPPPGPRPIPVPEPKRRGRPAQPRRRHHPAHFARRPARHPHRRARRRLLRPAPGWLARSIRHRIGHDRRQPAQLLDRPDPDRIPRRAPEILPRRRLWRPRCRVADASPQPDPARHRRGPAQYGADHAPHPHRHARRAGRGTMSAPPVPRACPPRASSSPTPSATPAPPCSP